MDFFFQMQESIHLGLIFKFSSRISFHYSGPVTTCNGGFIYRCTKLISWCHHSMDNNKAHEDFLESYFLNRLDVLTVL